MAEETGKKRSNPFTVIKDAPRTGPEDKSTKTKKAAASTKSSSKSGTSSSKVTSSTKEKKVKKVKAPKSEQHDTSIERRGELSHEASPQASARSQSTDHDKIVEEQPVSGQRKSTLKRSRAIKDIMKDYPDLFKEELANSDELRVKITDEFKYEDQHAYNPKELIPLYYQIVWRFYEESNAMVAKNEEHITLQLSLELAKDYSKRRVLAWLQKPPFPLWTGLSSKGDTVETHAGDRNWQKEILKIEGESAGNGHGFHVAPSNKSFESRAGFDVVWMFDKHTYYLQAKVFGGTASEDDQSSQSKKKPVVNFTYNNCLQLMALQLTKDERKADPHRHVFYGYLVYGGQKELWLIPLDHITHVLEHLYEKGENKVAPNVNMGYQNRILTKLFCTPTYLLKEVLLAAKIPDQPPDSKIDSEAGKLHLRKPKATSPLRLPGVLALVKAGNVKAGLNSLALQEEDEDVSEVEGEGEEPKKDRKKAKVVKVKKKDVGDKGKGAKAEEKRKKAADKEQQAIDSAQKAESKKNKKSSKTHTPTGSMLLEQ
ncbi:hypothetical protein FB45DRAFT_935260 [Roridomyces roridus]|uniref:Uncharacterized protein n=1 Tax=Roridomyces roridus TaxID=1738132 RepID=A0AAD7BBJ1_9AGAR|nr:hypothetical protein FB45DRAFT_935260 [Roridomyces roridus]